MYFEVVWIEEEDYRIQRIFRAKGLPALWTAIKYKTWNGGGKTAFRDEADLDKGDK